MTGRGGRLLLMPLLLWIEACATHVPRPTLEMARGNTTRLDELRAGFEIYRAKCSGCHSLYAVEHCSPQEWPLRVDEMVDRKKVRFDPGERERVLGYLCTAAAQ